MGWINRLFKGRSTPPQTPPPAGAAGVYIEGRAEPGWRPLSGSTRDLTPTDQARMQRLAYHAWEQHRLANRLIELPIAFVLGDGVRVTCADVEAQAWLDAWWSDPINRMDLSLEKRVRELALYGEQVIVVFAAPSGLVRHGAVDPASITAVITDPDNAALPIGIKVQSAAGEERIYKVILDGEDGDLLMPAALAERERMSAGSCHYWRVNDLLTGQRGRSDLLSAIDIADAYSQLIFGEVERAAALRTAIWDVTLTGATPEEVAARAATIAPPSPMSVRVHNDAETWQALSPKLEAADASETLRVVRNEVLGGATIPEHWYGGGGDVNRATAAEMDEPTYRVFRRRQLLWRAILEAEARHVIRARLSALGRGMAELPEEMRPSAEFPPMQSVDMSRYAQALAQIVTASASAVERALMTDATAVTLIATAADKLGVEIDAAAELAAAQAAKARRDEADVYRMPPGDPVEPPEAG